MENNKEYIFTVTYNFDGDYVAKKCETYEKAIEMLNEDLAEEIGIIKRECGYTPSILKLEDDDVVLVYAEGYKTDTSDRNYATEDCAYYRIFEVEK